LALASFLAKHPEFAQETQPGGSEGASIRAVRDANAKKITPTGNPRLYAFERQRQRIQARLDAPADGGAVKISSPPSAERIAAEAVVAEAQRELGAANRELEDSLSKFTDRHPSVIKAQDRVAAAQQRLRHAQATIPPDNDIIVAPATAEDRVKLQKELARLNDQIGDLQRGAAGATARTAGTDNTSWIVQLETEHTNLRRSVNQQRERVNALAESAFRAQLDASRKLAEAGGRLSVVDPAFRPVRPSGPGKTIFMIAGMVLFLSLGFALAVGLAVIDDRLYRRADLDQLDIAVLAVIPPSQGFSRKRRKAA
ncbi:MAG: hypothetical protein H0V17_33090, partial [Deltaproteobacteria bacterium]|nr:hypothetical protein [Deltaproteobacteria bacterium]